MACRSKGPRKAAADVAPAQDEESFWRFLVD